MVSTGSGYPSGVPGPVRARVAGVVPGVRAGSSCVGALTVRRSQAGGPGAAAGPGDRPADMTEYTDDVYIAIAPNVLFDYLSDVENVPRYMPRVTHAHEIGDGAVEVHATPKLADGSTVDVQGSAWTRIDAPGRTMSWGSIGGRHGYKGLFDVDADGDGSRLFVRIRSERADGAAVRVGLQDTLTKIKSIVEG